MSNAISSFGADLQMSDMASTPVFTSIAEVRDITGPTLSAGTAEVTNHLSTGRYREFISTVLDAGEVTFDIGYIPTNATHDPTTGLLDAFESGVVTDFKLVFPDAGSTTWDFSGIVTGFESQIVVDGDLKASITIKLTGQPTLR